MPFTAIVNGKVVSMTDIQQPRIYLKDKEITCRSCGEPMYFRGSFRVRSHFAHYGNQERDCLYDHINESEEHLAGKADVAKYLAKHPLYQGAVIDFEVPLLDIRRVADVLVTHSNGIQEVHEIQLSPQRPDQIEERTNDYLKLPQIREVTWWLGGKANTNDNRTFINENYGYNATIKFHKERDYMRTD